MIRHAPLVLLLAACVAPPGEPVGKGSTTVIGTVGGPVTTTPPRPTTPDSTPPQTGDTALPTTDSTDTAEPPVDCVPLGIAPGPTETRLLEVPGALAAADADLVLSYDQSLSPVVGGGDVTGDGRADLVVATTGAGYPLYPSVDIYVVPGDQQGVLDLPDAASLIVPSDFPYPFGILSPLAVADLDGTGPRLLLQASTYTDDGAAVYGYGHPMAPVDHRDAPLVLQGTSDRFGQAVAVGDLDGDGLHDVAVGQGTQLGGGSVFVMPTAPGTHAPASALATVHRPEKPDTFNSFGDRIAIGDLDDDGHDDLVVTDPGYYEVTPSDPIGAVYVFFGPLQGDLEATAADVTLLGPEENLRLGASVVVADIDGDCIDDLVVGATPYSLLPGRVHIVYGPLTPTHSTIDAVEGFRLEGTNDFDRTGAIVELAGDVDGNGHPDLLLSRDLGEVLVVLSPITPSEPLLGARIHDPGDGFGRHASGVGDLDGDGLDDVQVSTWPTGGVYDPPPALVYTLRGRANW